MLQKITNRKSYPFAWLDEVTELTLNPQKGDLNGLRDEELICLQHQFGLEVRKVISNLKLQIFWICSLKKKRILLQQYTGAIHSLKTQAVYNHEHYPEDSALKSAGRVIISYLEELSIAINRRYAVYLPEMKFTDEKQVSGKSEIFKIVCELSVDQMGIILKAADDVKLLISRSLSTVFKSIVPYLSTKNKSELSWDSMRSNSYHPEERDKEAAIAALEKLIKKIRDY